MNRRLAMQEMFYKIVELQTITISVESDLHAFIFTRVKLMTCILPNGTVYHLQPQKEHKQGPFCFHRTFHDKLKI